MTTSLSGNRGPAGNKIPKGYETGQLQQFTPDQLDLFKSLFSQVGPQSQLAGLARGDQSAFGPMEQQAARQFQEFQGQLGSRFSNTGAGAMSSRRGSGFQNAATQGAQDFAMQLAEKRQGLQRQALMDLMGISSSLLEHRPYEQFLIKQQPKQRPGWAQMLGGALPAIGAGVGAFGGPLGMALGGAAGNLLGSAFSGRESQAPDWSSMASLPSKWGT